MAEKNYTIPINEVFDEADGCPVCRLHKKLELQSLDYLMGAAMMEPDVRIETNRVGLCRKHFDDTMNMGNRLSLALILESYLDGLDAKLEAVSGAAGGKSGAAEIQRANDGCFVCERTAHTMERYADNLLYMWRTMPEFRVKFERQPFICFNHAALLLAAADRKPAPVRRFSKTQEPQFHDALKQLARKRLDVLRDEVGRFCKSFDYRFAGQELGEAAQGVEHAIAWLLGDGK